jgi:hypothetical protein
MNALASIRGAVYWWRSPSSSFRAFQRFCGVYMWKKPLCFRDWAVNIAA